MQLNISLRRLRRNDCALLLIDFNVEGVTAMRAAASAAGLGADRVIAVPSMAEGIYVA